MFGVGLSEIFLVFLVLILFVKPEDLPGMIRKIGEFYAQIQRMYYAVLDELDQFGESPPRR